MNDKNNFSSKIKMIENMLFFKKLLTVEGLEGYYFAAQTNNTGRRRTYGKNNDAGTKPASSLDNVGKNRAPQTRGDSIRPEENMNEPNNKKSQPESDLESADEPDNDEDTGSGQSDTDSPLDNAQKQPLDKAKRNPLLWQILAIIIIIVLILTFIAACFTKKELTSNPGLMCGGASVLDSLYVLVVNENNSNEWISLYPFYTLVASRVYDALGPYENENVKEAYYAQAIVETNNILTSPDVIVGSGGKYRNQFNDKIKEYNKRACGKEKLEDFACIDEKNFKGKIIKIKQKPVSEEDVCNTAEGCLVWRNTGLEETFGIKDESCFKITAAARGNKSREIITRKCQIQKSLTAEEVENINKEGTYKIIDEGGSLYVEVIAHPEDLSNHEEFSKIYSLVFDIRGVLMTNAEGYPQKLEYSKASEGCGAGMCVGEGAGETTFKQAAVDGWPVHRILTHWYPHFFASWSALGIESCTLYRPNPINSKRQFNRVKVDGNDGYRFLYPNDPDAEVPAGTNMGKYNKPHPDHKNVDFGIEKCIATQVEKDNDRLDLMLARRHKYIELPEEIAGHVDQEFTPDDAIDEINKYIYTEVTKKGIGTRDGVVMAGVSLKNYLEKGGPNSDTQNSYTLAYNLGGVYRHYGVNRSWGAPVPDLMAARRGKVIINYERDPEGKYPCEPWTASGMDCVGFTEWAQYNGGLAAPWNHTNRQGDLYSMPKYTNYYSDGHDWNEHSKVALPGDIIYQGRPIHGGCCIHSMMAAGMIYDQNGVLVGTTIIHESGGLTIDRLSIQKGFSLSLPIEVNDRRTMKDVFEDGWNDYKYTVKEPSNALVEGQNYTEREDEAHKRKGVIDYSACFNKREGYEDICKHIDTRDFFAGLIKK